MKNKFGKSSINIIKVKQDFFTNNDKLLKENSKIFKLYSKQPLRTKCKNCNKKIKYKHYFYKEKIKYFICSNCKHVNGIYEDTKDFCNYVYADNEGLNYSKSYYEDNIKVYKLRTKEIYKPKAKFLVDSLINERLNVNKFKYVDIGAGSGYFVNALLGLGVKNLEGYDVSKTQVNLGNRMMKKKVLKHHKLDEIDKIIINLKADVVSLIGVLEHMRNPFGLLKSIKKNKRIKYLYLSVPTFSFSVFFEMVFPYVMQRQLSGDHTHLYTKESIDWLIKKFNFKKVTAWWFGSDMMDLHRNMVVSLLRKKDTSNVTNLWEQNFLKCLDDLQLILDKNFMSSEVHLLLRVKR